MLRALWAAASGMIAQQTNVDVISHNLANVNTPGYKGSRVDFADVVWGEMAASSGASASAPAQGTVTPGSGVHVIGTQRSFGPGQLEPTQRPLDLAIDGPGFFTVELSNGDKAYTRSGSFRLDASGNLCTPEGWQVEVSGWSRRSLEQVDAESIRVNPDGTVTGRVDGDEEELGTIELVRFPNPAGLEAIGNGLYRATSASGEPDSDGAGEIMQGFLERANVQVVEEMVALITAQRAYEMNSKVVQAADDMLGMANNLRR